MEPERGPVYGVELLTTLPLGSSHNMRQAMPGRDELIRVRVRSERTVAAYEILTAAYRRLKRESTEARKAFDDWNESGSWDNPELRLMRDAIEKLPSADV